MDTNPIPSPPVPPQPVTPTPITPTTPPKPKNWLLISLIILIILLSLGAAGFFAYQYVQLIKQVAQTPPVSPKPTAKAEDLTANWKTYTNTAGYSIKYPASFTTQLIAAGAGNREANAETRNLFIYKSDAPEPYLERYINLETFQVKPTYNQGTITKTTLDNQTVEKIVIPDAKFDIYSAQLVNKGFIEIYVSSDPTTKEVANQILSTFKFLEQSADASSEIKVVVTTYLKNNGHDLSKVTVSKPQKLGTLTDVYTVGWTETGYVGGGRYVLVGKKDNQWIIPTSGDSTYCGWIKSAGLDDATRAFMGPTCQ